MQLFTEWLEGKSSGIPQLRNDLLNGVLRVFVSGECILSHVGRFHEPLNILTLGAIWTFPPNLCSVFTQDGDAWMGGRFIKEKFVIAYILKATAAFTSQHNVSPHFLFHIMVAKITLFPLVRWQLPMFPPSVLQTSRKRKNIMFWSVMS